MQSMSLRMVISWVDCGSVRSRSLCLGWLESRCCGYKVGGGCRVLVCYVWLI